MDVICLEEVAFYSLIEQVVIRLKESTVDQKDKWISDKEAMKLLKVKSKTTLQKFRDEGKIRFSQPQKKIILYDRESIEIYLNKTLVTLFNYGRIDEVDQDYQKGFNDGYIFAKHLPELSEQLSKTEWKSNRGLGFLDGRKQFITEQVKEKFPDWLKGNRTNPDKTNPDKDKGRSIEPEK